MRFNLLLAALGVIALPAIVPAPLEEAAAKKAPPGPVFWDLGLRLHAQETPNWCWAASGQMVMEHYGMRVSQAAQADHRFKRSDCGHHPCPKACNHGGWPDWHFYHFSASETNRPLSRETLVHQIYTLKKPVTYLWSWTGGGAHVMVVGGYARLKSGAFMLQILNPAPPLHEDKKTRRMVGGDVSFITYKEWVSAPGHKLTQVDFNITKKK